MAATSVLEANEALRHLIAVALGDTGQSRRCANFVLAWWNADQHGGFDLADLWNVDAQISAAMATVFAHVADGAVGSYPDHYRPEIEQIIARHRGRQRRRAA